jgi:Auxiliary Activity family 9 (formerly GH61)
MVWLYPCEASFTSCDGSGKKWFKIDEMGLTAPPLASDNWGNAKVEKSKQWTSKIPTSIKSGNYLIRHELLALHSTNSPQFYPECAQLKITGGGSALPSGDFLASIPGYANQANRSVTVRS